MATFLGHKDRCFDIKIRRNRPEGPSSESDYYLLSSSEDGTCILWLYSFSCIKSRRPIYVFKHSTDSEVLRSVFMSSNVKSEGIDVNNVQLAICTCGADGIAAIWKQNVIPLQSCQQSSPLVFNKLYQLTHSGDQIYACESIDSNTLLTAAGDKLYVWIVNNGNEGEKHQPFLSWKFSDNKYSLFSSYFTGQSSIVTDYDDIQLEFTADSQNNNKNTHFGGERNPNKAEYLFDVKCNPANRFICAIATSESTIHTIDLHSCSGNVLPLKDNVIPIIINPQLYHQEVQERTSSFDGLSLSLNNEIFKFVTSVSEYMSSCKSFLMTVRIYLCM